MIKRILRNLFGIYALVIFLLTLLTVIFFYVIIFSTTSEKKAPFIAHKYISRNWARTLFFFFGIRIKIHNRNLLDKNKTYVFVANHLAQLDIPAYAISTDHTFRFLAKEELTKIPLMGYIIRKLYISVNRKDKIARARSMDNMKRSLDDHISIFICPEGTRNKTEEHLVDFRNGAFRLAIQAQRPLAVMTIINSGKLQSPNRPIELSPGIIHCIWDKPIDTTGMTDENVQSLKDQAREMMIRNLKKYEK